MTDYAEAALAVRRAREARDAAADDLYRAQLDGLALDAARQREARGEGVFDPAAESTLRRLEGKRQTSVARRQAVVSQLDGLASVDADIDRLETRLTVAPEAEQALIARIAQLANALESKDESADRRQVQAELQTLQRQRAALADAVSNDREALTAARDQQSLTEDLRSEATELAANISDLQHAIKLEAGRAREVDLDAITAETQRVIDNARDVKSLREADVRAAMEVLYGDRPPQELIEAWDDDIPITLLPLRLETRWKTDPGAPPQFWVRVYPDDIGVHNHEPTLTVPEVTHGQLYWTATREAAGAADSEAVAWNALARRFGGNRAAWVARQTQALNWDEALADPEVVLNFPDLPTKSDPWTVAPHSRVLPDRFVLLAWRGDELRVNELGEVVDDVVVLGPSPVDATVGEAAIGHEDENHTLEFGEAFRWVRDFDDAVDRGMGFRVDISAEDVDAGFDRLLVLGLKLSADAAEAKAMVETLIANHHYSEDGLELVTQGTPTNNTDGNDSGYTRAGETGVAGASPPRFTPGDDRSAASDGQRFADFLGIDYATLQHVDGSDHNDHVEAVAMNRALYAGTLGYYFDHMLNEVIDESTFNTLRQRITDQVTGRGPVAAIRVGDQPYGILPTSSMARWRTPKIREDDNGNVMPAEPVERALVSTLRAFDEAWTSLLPGVSQLGSGEDPSASLLKILGLHPTSAEFHHRVGYSYDYLRNLEEFAWGGENIGDVIRMALEGMAARGVLHRFGYTSAREDGTSKPDPLLLQLIWRHYQTALDPLQLIDGQPLSEEATVQPYNAAGGNYLDWLIANSADAAALEAQDFDGADRPTALLYMLLHFSLVMEGSRAIHHWLGDREVNADELLRSRKFLNVTGASPSVWEVFHAPANSVVRTETATDPLYSLMHAPQQAATTGIWVQKQRAALETLRDLPTARLERALVEHVDTLSYRLDAWQISLFTDRLQKQRRLDAPVEERRTGLYLGAYGYLENLRPSDRGRTRVAEPVEDDVLPQGARPELYRESGNGGRVMTPTLNHATAAALLLSGYQTHAVPEDPDALAVNLSSGRVQRAKALLEGIQNEQSLESLLGAQFERGLQDWTTRPVNPVILSQLKPLFRARFPIVRTRVPQAANAAAGAAEIEEDYKVVNGLALAQTTAPFPWGIAELSALSASQQQALQTEKDAIENTLDAMRDLLTAESAYQLALGNFDRAAAVLQSTGNGTLPPDIEVINTVRGTGVAFTQRLAVQFDDNVVANPWGATQSARADLDPPLNAWLGDLLGAPDRIACHVAAVDADGAVIIDGGGPVEGTITLEDLDLQPVDFVYLVRSQSEPSGAAELELRVRYRFVRDRALPDETIVRIAFADDGGGADMRSFAEVLPLADRLRKLLGTARPLNASHFDSASHDAPGNPDNPGRIDSAELIARVTASIASVRALFPLLQIATDAARVANDTAILDALRDELIKIARAGVSFAMPRSAVGAGAELRDVLVQQADELLARADLLGPTSDELLGKAAAATRAERVVSELELAARAWMGGDLLIVPRFDFRDPATVNAAHAASNDLLHHVRDVVGVPLPMEEWLHGVACVRERVGDFEIARAMADAVRDDPLPLAPVQFPFRSGDAWLGAEYPPDIEVVHDTVSVVRHLPQGFDAAGAQCGLLIDDWTESVPLREQVAGLCFNFDAPDSAPPQALLLAVTPRETGSWSWDDLVDTVLDTFRRAKLRAVEPDAIGELPGIGTLLPAVVAEFSTSAASVSLDYSMTIPEISAPVVQMMATPWTEG